MSDDIAHVSLVLGRNKLVKLLIWTRNIPRRTVRSLLDTSFTYFVQLHALNFDLWFQFSQNMRFKVIFNAKRRDVVRIKVSVDVSVLMLVGLSMGSSLDWNFLRIFSIQYVFCCSLFLSIS